MSVVSLASLLGLSDTVTVKATDDNAVTKRVFSNEITLTTPAQDCVGRFLKVDATNGLAICTQATDEPIAVGVKNHINGTKIVFEGMVLGGVADVVTTGSRSILQPLGEGINPLGNYTGDVTGEKVCGRTIGHPSNGVVRVVTAPIGAL